MKLKWMKVRMKAYICSGSPSFSVISFLTMERKGEDSGHSEWKESAESLLRRPSKSSSSSYPPRSSVTIRFPTEFPRVINE
ncbi:hypothetical protein SADUNF_Sadunf15G0089300 [Salix dunnii]|uniref:Uncharacterized protein n=1 Tax=Salix dunnii TaxID=1413687 RepID=A0A835JBD5_9ROSI|nr:hypothetical protein SADUNF_Sadunf15G0089300 [Salix dunnii]